MRISISGQHEEFSVPVPPARGLKNLAGNSVGFVRPAIYAIGGSLKNAGVSHKMVLRMLVGSRSAAALHHFLVLPSTPFPLIFTANHDDQI
jgi:hypothetical protein